jgi:hypothetical protein
VPLARTNFSGSLAAYLDSSILRRATSSLILYGCNNKAKGKDTRRRGNTDEQGRKKRKKSWERMREIHKKIRAKEDKKVEKRKWRHVREK